MNNFGRNPFTTQRFSGCAFRKSFNSKRLEVPNQDVPLNGSPEWYRMMREKQAQFQVPNQNVPNGDVYGSCVGFMPGSDRLFRLYDGTVLDFKSRRIVQRPRRAAPGEWAPMRNITYGGDDIVDGWNAQTGPTMEQMVANPEMYSGTALPDGSVMDTQLDPESARYWLQAEQEAKKLEAGMTDAQKQALADFEKHFPESKLIEESRKTK